MPFDPDIVMALYGERRERLIQLVRRRAQRACLRLIAEDEPPRTDADADTGLTHWYFEDGLTCSVKVAACGRMVWWPDDDSRRGTGAITCTTCLTLLRVTSRVDAAWAAKVLPVAAEGTPAVAQPVVAEEPTPAPVPRGGYF